MDTAGAGVHTAKGIINLASESPGFPRRVTTAGGGQACGTRVFNYVLRSDGVNDATVVFKVNNAAGAEIWKDICIGEDKSKPFATTKKPIGVRQKQTLFVEVSGTGAECDLSFE